jgi:hypothetical protein
MNIIIYVIIIVLISLFYICFNDNSNENYSSQDISLQNDAIQNISSMYNKNLITSTNMKVMNNIDTHSIQSNSIQSNSIQSDNIKTNDIELKNIKTNDIELKNIKGNVTFNNPITLPANVLHL